MKILGVSLKVLGMLVWIVVGLWGLFICLGIISHAAGFWGVVAAIFLAPITFLAAPLYAGFEQNNWFPLILNYGGGLVAIVLIGIGSLLSGD